MRELNLAYSLSHDEDVWRWSVYDEDGVTVADGFHATQAAAQQAVEITLRSAGGDTV
ncbi:MAG: hypothetical protein KKE02_20020 [Alphaproteobacteria bacterium]|nr:hypothetical protein [Alphaproteobacteria bacterium]MBU1514760.1 hypothetical protein [Alphaproteobacteria bacterium]MBU2093891.1 hypothetical protein [Alphaproteobacteria bacterium]MBU2153318.1 hypothetical protein [Alphaproteobacteria bacterium]MBU2309746.1 hypothetical protein [Alphaproteobacteria bacterium]